MIICGGRGYAMTEVVVMSKSRSARPGRPPKGPELFDQVLYVRVPKSLKERLRERADSERERRPGQVISDADVVREILMAALNGGEG